MSPNPTWWMPGREAVMPQAQPRRGPSQALQPVATRWVPKGAPLLEFFPGEPPGVGWFYTRFIAGDGHQTCDWRWWDGKFWSLGVNKTAAPQEAETCASIRTAIDNTRIQYSMYWPIGARVARPRYKKNEDRQNVS